MATVRFNGPGDMVLKGIGLTLLGIVLLPFGIGFIGALVGPIWVIQGIAWAARKDNGQSTTWQPRRNYVEIDFSKIESPYERIVAEVSLLVSRGLPSRGKIVLDNFMNSFDAYLLTEEEREKLKELRQELIRLSKRKYQ